MCDESALTGIALRGRILNEDASRGAALSCFTVKFFKRLIYMFSDVRVNRLLRPDRETQDRRDRRWDSEKLLARVTRLKRKRNLLGHQNARKPMCTYSAINLLTYGLVAQGPVL